MKLNLIFDLDDTLVECGKYYRAQQEEFAEFQSNRTGLPPELIYKLRENIDVTFTSTSDGFSRARFPRSFASTSITIDLMLGHSIDEDAKEQSFMIGDKVFNAMYPLLDGIDTMLTSYLDNDHKLFLLTKGDYDVQIRKVALNGLRQWFDNECIYIVGQKTPDELHSILINHSLDPDDTVMIGDSLRDDIGTAKSLGVTSVWINNNNSLAWGYENVSCEADYELNHASKLVHLINPIKGQFTL